MKAFIWCPPPGAFVLSRVGMFCPRQSFGNSPVPTLSPGRLGVVGADQIARHATALSYAKSSTYEHTGASPRPGTARSEMSSEATPARRTSRRKPHREVSHDAGSSAKVASRASPQGFPPVRPNSRSRLDFTRPAAHLPRVHSSKSSPPPGMELCKANGSRVSGRSPARLRKPAR